MNSADGSGGPLAGWYPDPEDPRQQRWWDGAAWTDNRMPTTSQPASSWDPGHGQTGTGVVGPSTPTAGMPPGTAGPLPGVAPTATGDVRGLAVSSLVLGIVGIFFAVFCWPIGLVCALIGLSLGGVALSRIRKGQADPSVRGLALAGVIVSGFTVALSLIALVLVGAVLVSEPSRL